MPQQWGFSTLHFTNRFPVSSPLRSLWLLWISQICPLRCRVSIFEGVCDLGNRFIIFDLRYPFHVYSFCFLQFQSPDLCWEPSGFLFLWKEVIFLPVETLVILPPHLKTFFSWESANIKGAHSFTSLGNYQGGVCGLYFFKLKHDTLQPVILSKIKS